MMFVTVGTQIPFDRLVSVVNVLAKEANARVFAQTGPTKNKYSNIKCVDYLEFPDFERRFNEADFVISHAGMGSILNALTSGKPIIIMPRQASLGEHRNDHQIGTAKRFEDTKGVFVAWDEKQLLHILRKNIVLNSKSKTTKISEYAPTEFLEKLSRIINR